MTEVLSEINYCTHFVYCFTMFSDWAIRIFDLIFNLMVTMVCVASSIQHYSTFFISRLCIAREGMMLCIFPIDGRFLCHLFPYFPFHFTFPLFRFVILSYGQCGYVVLHPDSTYSPSCTVVGAEEAYCSLVYIWRLVIGTVFASFTLHMHHHFTHLPLNTDGGT